MFPIILRRLALSIPLLVIGFAVSWFLKEIPLRDTTGPAPGPSH